MAINKARKRKFTLIILFYPVVLIAISLCLNVFWFGITTLHVALPSPTIISAVLISGFLLTLNHTWLMTATELTRLNHGIYASPEEWIEKAARKSDVSEHGWIELERHHNAHRNATENTVVFMFLMFTFSLISPASLAAQVWIIGFGVARLGYTYCALRGKSDLRGLFMSLSLAALYGLAGYMLLSLIFHLIEVVG